MYGRSPKIGENASAYSVLYAMKLVQSMASGFSHAVAGMSEALAVRIRSLLEVALDVDDVCPGCSTESVYPARPWLEGPEWISELCDCLPFKEMFRYRSKKTGHINVNELRTL